MNTEAISPLILILGVVPLAVNWLLMIKIKQLKSGIKNSHQKTLGLLDFVRKQQSRKTSLKNKQALVEKTVNDSTVAVETIHQTLSDAAFNVINNLSSTNKIKARNQKLRDLHDQTSSDVYKSVKVVNKQVGAITDALLSTRKTPSSKTATKSSPLVKNKRLTTIDNINDRKRSKRQPPKE
ncbi:hypothetical protein [Alkalimarinus coralli]|uniref:hypothetical protein n=1 Tax=Alkalimarinus coralli TaxID=2935863 RepID=UPI00202B112A|nr:hypothetical protein [Alkalimarinus coralli]